MPAMSAWALRQPDRPALHDDAGRGLSWFALPRAVATEQERLRRQLRDTCAPVAIQASQGIAHAIAELALHELGIPVLVVPSFFTAAQTAHALQSSGAQAVLRDGGHALRVEPLAAAADNAVLPSGTARITFTSGSTGTPKGICLAARHLLAVAGAVRARVGGLPGSRHLAILPPSLLLETVAGLQATLLAGGCYLAYAESGVGLAAPFRPDFAMMAAAIRTAAPRSIILVPEYLAGLVMLLEHSGARLPSLGLVAVGGARVGRGLLERALAVGLPVCQGYGMTECGSVVTLHDGDADSLGSVGTSLGLHQVRLAPDGEILIEGPLCLGTLAEERAPGVFATGDIGHRDEEGRLWIDGRRPNRIVTSFGRNISPEWPECLLLESPAIAQCMVHGDDSPELAALIVPRGPAAAVEAGVAAANARLPAYARIGRWRPVAPFTSAEGLLTGNGRLRRSAIARRHLQEESADAIL